MDKEFIRNMLEIKVKNLILFGGKIIGRMQ